MSSRIAAIVAVLNGTPLDPLPKGVGPRPVHSRSTFPCITVSEVMAKELESLSGMSGAVFAPMQIGCWSKSYEEAWALREAVKARLMAMTGAAGDHIVLSVNHGTDRELYDDQRELHHLIEVLRIWWQS